MQKWNQILEDFYSSLKCPVLPEGYDCMNPYLTQACMEVVGEFGARFMNDSNRRTLIVGINPGRLGAGITGIPFTDPIHLNQSLGIQNESIATGRAELSSQFIYESIHAFGGPDSFYQSFFISSVFPLGFLKDGKNLNYYELPNWKSFMIEEVVANFKTHMKMPIHTDVCICIGKGENLKFLQALNTEFQWFDEIIPLPHPRWVLQYRRKEKEKHLLHYVEVLEGVLSSRS